MSWLDPLGIIPTAHGTNATSNRPAPHNTAPSYGASGAPVTNINTGGSPAATVTGSASAPTFAPPGASAPNPDPNGTGLQPGQGSPGDVGYNGNVPGVGEQVGGSLLNYYGANGTPSTSNDAAQAYKSFQASTPANMSPYYDNAERNSVNDINKQMAARGQFGSSNAVGQISNATTNLRAQQAKDEASYGLQRAGLAGTLGSGADASSAASSNNDLSWMSGLSNLGFQTQKEGMARYELGNQDAKMAADTASGIVGQNGQAAISNDQQLMVQQLMAQYGMTQDAATAAANKLSSSQATDARGAATVASAAAYFV